MSVKEDVEGLKVKKKPKKLANKKAPETIKVDLSKKEEEVEKVEIKEDAVQESSTEKVDVRELPADGKEVGETHSKEEKVAEEGKKEEISVYKRLQGKK